jgi:hypothetical protein
MLTHRDRLGSQVDAVVQEFGSADALTAFGGNALGVNDRLSFDLSTWESGGREAFLKSAPDSVVRTMSQALGPCMQVLRIALAGKQNGNGNGHTNGFHAELAVQ